MRIIDLSVNVDLLEIEIPKQVEYTIDNLSKI